MDERHHRFTRALETVLLAAVVVVSGCAPPEEPSQEARSVQALVYRAIRLDRLASVATGVLATETGGAAEIAAYDPGSRRLFSVNAVAGRVDILDIANPSAPVAAGALATGGVPNSVAVRDGVVAVAVEGTPRTSPGRLELFDAATGALLNAVGVGAVPDMVTFTPDGSYILVANEGEPSPDYLVDPEGSVSVVAMGGGVGALTQASVRTARFVGVPEVNPASVRHFGPNKASPELDFEPEYVTVSHDSKTAWVTLQEANAVAVLDVRAGRFTKVVGLGFKDHLAPGNALDASDRDGRINIASWPVRGMSQPDAIDSFRVKGKTYLVTANEGDARDWPGYSELKRVADLTLDPVAFPDAAVLRASANLGRLRVTNALGDPDGDGKMNELYSLGARSFSIWSADLAPVYDSGDDLERRTADLLPAVFNSDNGANNSFDNRSDDKGPEPEGVVVGKAFGGLYAFVALERIGGIAIYDVSEPAAPMFVTYVNPRDFSAPSPAMAGDLGPEGLLFIEGDASPNGRPLLVVSNEVSGTTTVYEVAK